VSLDPKKYALAQDPWPYRQLAAIMTVWGFEPVGDHSPSYLLNLDGLLVWEKIGQDATRQAFVISTPKWRSRGQSAPCWPARVIMDALASQHVLHRTGLMDPAERMAEMTLRKK
jgi:hypothetical protein